jgi:hypothetical protein
LAKRWEARPRGAFYNADRERRAWHGVRVKSVGERAGPPGVACSVVVRAHGGVASGRVALGYDRWVRAGLAGGRHGTGRRHRHRPLFVPVHLLLAGAGPARSRVGRRSFGSGKGERSSVR